MQFSSDIFWDTDSAELDIHKNADYIIDRVVGYGTLEDWRTILDIYGHDKVKETVTQ